MAGYIDRDAFIAEKRMHYCAACKRRQGMKNGKMQFCYEIGDAPCRACDVADMLDYIEDFPAADVVSREAFDQVMWERDVAIAQLAEVGKSLGERMDDVCRVGSYGDCGCGIKDGAGECCRKNVLTEEGG